MVSIIEWLRHWKRSPNKPVRSTHHPNNTPVPPNQKKRASFLDLPSELRNRVYESALLVPYIITNYPPPPKSPSTNHRPLRSQDWEYHLSLRTCFHLMSTCRQVHRETLPIFYGINTFYLEVISLVQDRALRGPDFRAGEVRCDDDEQWRVRCHVRSEEARRLIRKVAVRTWDCEDLERRRMKALNLGQRVRSAGGGVLGRYRRGWFPEEVEEEWKFLRNVETVSVFFGTRASRALKVPLMDEEEWNLAALRRVVVPRGMYSRVVDAWKLYQTTIGAMGLLKRGMPGLRNVMFWCTEVQAEVGGREVAGKRIHGLCTFTPMLRELFRCCDGHGFERSSLAVMKMPGGCLRCGSAWTKAHYSPMSPMKVCPGLGVAVEEDLDQQEDVGWTRRLERGQTLLPFGSGPPEARAEEEEVKAFGHYIGRSEHSPGRWTMMVHNCPRGFDAGFTRSNTMEMLMYH